MKKFSIIIIFFASRVNKTGKLRRATVWKSRSSALAAVREKEGHTSRHGSKRESGKKKAQGSLYINWTAWPDCGVLYGAARPNEKGGSA